jgi:superfamily II DNA/RNA helicase
MKAATISQIKQELLAIAPAELLKLCLRLAKYKKENKELLNYLLFEAHDEQGYVESVKKEVADYFRELPQSNLYLTKKSLRKILRITNRYIKYTGSRQAEVELLIYFCRLLKTSGIPVKKSTALTNLYHQQLKKINTAIALLHEDLQHDYRKETEELIDRV